MKKITVLLILILLSTSVLGYQVKEVYSDENIDRYLITKLPACYDKVLLKVSATEGLGNITFPNFEFNKDINLWETNCDKLNNYEVLLEVKNKDYNEYDIVVQHYIDNKLDLNSVRTLNFNNIRIQPQEIKKKPSEFIINWIQTIVFILVCIGILLILGFGIYKILTYETKEEREHRLFLERKDKKVDIDLEEDFKKMMEEIKNGTN